MLLHKWGMNSSIIITPERKNGAWAESDLKNAGNSITTLNVNNAFAFRCDISDTSSYDYPYCNLLIPISDTGEGVDLSEYESIYLTLEHNATGQDTPRIFLNNYYQEPVQFRTQFKMNLHKLDVKPGLNTYKLELSDFVVPYWWVCQSNDSNALPDFSNVKELMISTGVETLGRQVAINLHQVKINKKWIAEEKLYQLLVVGWITWILVLLSWRYSRLKMFNSNLFLESKKLLRNNEALDKKAKILKKEAITDPLTSLLNRLGIQEIIDECIELYVTSKVPFSVVMIDADYFKGINDAYGHDVGDKVLSQFALCIKNRCRPSDLSARWGGEEFLIVCSNTSGKNACILAERLREDISNTVWTHGEKVTASIGVAEVNMDSINHTIKNADIALYQAKSQGRNQVVFYEDN